MTRNKKFAAAFAILSILGVARLNAPMPLAELESLRVLDGLGDDAPGSVVAVRDAFTSFNGGALENVPLKMVVLRTENAIASVTLAAADVPRPDEGLTPLQLARSNRLIAAKFSLPAVVKEAAIVAVGAY